MATLAQMAANGELYRKRHCQKCGAEFSQKLLEYAALNYEGSQWNENDAFEPAPIGAVIINFANFPQEFGRRFQMRLCQNCAMEIYEFLESFQKGAET